MQRSFSKGVIIGVLAALLLALGGCSALRAGYTQAPQLVHWWLDGYLDLDDVQAVRARESLRAWFRWHRGSQLPDYAALLARAQAEFAEPMTPAQVCRLWDDVRVRLASAVDRAVPPAVELARTLAPEQLAHLQRRQAKNNADYRAEYLQDAPGKRLEASVRRVVDRAELLYGRLDDAQRRRIAQAVAASPFDAEAWLAERQRRQQDLVQALRRLATEAVPDEEAHGLLRRLHAQAWRSPRADYRAYQERLLEYNCAAAARLHNEATPEQRRRAVARLRSWEEDLRVLAGAS